MSVQLKVVSIFETESEKFVGFANQEANLNFRVRLTLDADDYNSYVVGKFYSLVALDNIGVVSSTETPTTDYIPPTGLHVSPTNTTVSLDTSDETSVSADDASSDSSSIEVAVESDASEADV